MKKLMPMIDPRSLEMMIDAEVEASKQRNESALRKSKELLKKLKARSGRS
ncbi:hypothetical protein J9317_18215 [Metabacillus sp. KIGAM252]|uniref:Uncharacterized protein n=1 Tax=Metabacillus flavus TaxID=2823519 RepID=A0ABS5LIV1_9BACI|nr:hypothetical protein [Metabacillus flavus]MBS2970681.1 hypothetical protein [Metabacillus flavus]